MFRALKKLREFIKVEAELTKAERRIANMPFDYLALQRIADVVSGGYEVKITVTNKDGSVIVIEKTNPKTELTGKTFQQSFIDYHNGVINK